MNKYYFEGKTQEQAINLALYELNISEDDLIVNNVEDKSSLLKKNVKIEVLNIKEIISFIKDTLNKITELMGAKSNLEVKRREKSISVTIFSENNAILIGKNGKNLKALSIIVAQHIMRETGHNFKFNIDINSYKEKREKSLENLAKRVAREVATTKIPVKLDSMNSYERRIIHNILTDNKKVYTESEGEEPNRCVVIKPKED